VQDAVGQISAIAAPTPWYKSKTQLVQIGQTVIGTALALGLISPQLGSVLTGNIEPIVGGVVALLGLFALIAHPTEVKATALQASKETVQIINGNPPLVGGYVAE